MTVGILTGHFVNVGVRAGLSIRNFLVTIGVPSVHLTFMSPDKLIVGMLTSHVVTVGCSLVEVDELTIFQCKCPTSYATPEMCYHTFSKAVK